MTHRPEPSRESSPLGPLRFLPALTLIAVLTITASAEFELARTVLHLPPYIAWALPVAVDSYVLAALRSGRDVLPALGVMGGSLAASMGAHLAGAGSEAALPAHVVAPAATGIMTVLVVVAWRVHVLIEYLAANDHRAAAVPSGAAPTAPVPAPSAVVAAGAVPADRVPETALERRAATGTPADVPAGIAVPAPAEEPTGTPPETARPVPAMTDAQILAQLRAEAGDGPPSIRTLKRRYGIGQARATRLHRQAARAAEQHSHEAAEHDPDHAQSSRTEATQSQRSVIQEVSQEAQEPSTGIPAEKVDQESAGKAGEETHPCITDRVGPPRRGPGATPGVSEPLSEALFPSAPGAPVVVEPVGDR